MINSGNIKIRAIEKKEEAKSGKLYTNNYYSYNIDRHIKTDYHNISMEKGEKIHICCFDIVKSRANKVISTQDMGKAVIEELKKLTGN